MALSRLPPLLARLSSEIAYANTEAPEEILNGLTVDAVVPGQKLTIELVGDSELGPAQDSPVRGVAGLALSRGVTRALKWRILVQRGWTVAWLPAKALGGSADELSRLAGIIDGLHQGRTGPSIVQVADLPSNSRKAAKRLKTTADRSSSAAVKHDLPLSSQQTLKRNRSDIESRMEEEVPPASAAKVRTVMPPVPPPPPSRSSPPASTPPSALPSARTEEITNAGEPVVNWTDLVLLDLTHGNKRKRLQLPPATLVSRLIQDYGKVVKGDGTVIVVDQDGVEMSTDIELGILAAEAKAITGNSHLKLQLKLDDWLAGL
jgi:hypothetical protein